MILGPLEVDGVGATPLRETDKDRHIYIYYRSFKNTFSEEMPQGGLS